MAARLIFIGFGLTIGGLTYGRIIHGSWAEEGREIYGCWMALAAVYLTRKDLQIGLIGRQS